MSDTTLFRIHTDGAARGNPGPAAFAFVIERDGQPDIEENGCLGEATNNQAEYTALVRALERAAELNGKRLHIFSDSELLVNQMNGVYKMKNEGLRPLYDRAKALCRHFDAVSIRHVRREQNSRADLLCNEALDNRPRTRPAVVVAKKEPAVDRGLECLREAALQWAKGDPHQPPVEEVWEQLRKIIKEGR